MKRIFFGFVWFVVISFAGFVLGGAIVGAIAGSKVMATNMSEGYAKGQQAGHAAGAEFAHRFGGVLLLGALGISIAGTAAGVLPGTKKKSSK